ncbi:hypothetical protein NX02_14110 [Sphingomonas sanxanigenens DSM 19645 = NX02]|uniref:Pole-organizing protein PopZ n=2 Tax=Sphingomonas sanxanigenens TaxID=397260 RepID=W0AFU0_9SPHN|nr:hypothetical protein NX02_14110 [Sphingomonas sanxanigenens DSM 19645 = NX02]
MEEILASIKRIIAEENDGPRRAAIDEDQPDDPADDAEPAAAGPGIPASSLVSDAAAEASRQALSSLSGLVVRDAAPGDNTLEGLVRDLLRPMLREWLDAHLPAIVEALVGREISRLSDRN